MKKFFILFLVLSVSLANAAVLDRIKVQDAFKRCVEGRTNFKVESSRIKRNISPKGLALDFGDEIAHGGGHKDQLVINAMFSRKKNYFVTEDSGIAIEIEVVNHTIDDPFFNDAIYDHVTFKLSIPLTPLFTATNSDDVAAGIKELECEWTVNELVMIYDRHTEGSF